MPGRGPEVAFPGRGPEVAFPGRGPEVAFPEEDQGFARTGRGGWRRL